MSDQNTVVAIYKTPAEAEVVIKTLRKWGFNMKKLSIIVKNTPVDEHLIDHNNVGNHLSSWDESDALWRGLSVLFLGWAFFWIPGIGPLRVGGPFVVVIARILERSTSMGGLSALGAGLYSLGIPQDSILKYEMAIKDDQCLVIAQGTEDEVTRARDIIKSMGTVEFGLHHA